MNRFMTMNASHWLRCAVVLVALGTVGIASAYSPNLATVPWLGNPALPHQVYSGGQLVLQGVATDLDNGAALCISNATWDSGAGPTYNAGANGYALEATHTYTGAVGQPFTATLTVTLCDTTVLTDTMRVVVRADNQEVRVNMAIDKGLWNLHKRMVRTTSDGLPSGRWSGYSSFYMAATAGVVQAFEINNHREGGNRLEDPYVDNVARGLRYILSQQHGVLTRVNINLQGGNNPDTNGNGYGLYINYSNHASYLGGQLMDALVATGTPDKIAETGQVNWVRGRKYKDIIQDLLDGYSWGMNDSVGGWHYSYNAGSNDTSASHWWAIGVLAGEVWGLDAPDWVKSIQWNTGVPLMQRWNPPGGCYFGYTGSWSSQWGDNQTNVTAAGLIMMNADDVPQTDPRYTCAMQWLADKFFVNRSYGNYYTWYQLTKAMRTAIDGTETTAPVTLLGTQQIDWYSEVADYLITTQQSSGAFPSTQGSIGQYIQTDMASSWAMIMLSPSLFELPPTASCNASPLIDGTAGIGGNVNFDGSQSAHPDSERTIVSYSWNFDDGSANETGETASHSFDNVGIYDVVLTVEDDNGNTDTDTCQIDVRDNDIPPAARPGGPYTFCLGDAYDLDGSASSDLDNQIVSWEWDVTSPVNFSPVDLNGDVVTAPATAFPAVGLYDIGLQVTDNDGGNGGTDHTSQSFTTVNIIPADDPSCNQPPVAVDGGPYTVNEGSTVTLSGSGSSDPDGDTLTYAWDLDDDGTFETAGETTVFDASLLDDSVVPVSLRVSDPSGASNESMTTVTVLNVAPAVDAGADATIDEGTAFVSGGSFTDPGTLDTWTATVDYGEGAGSEPLTLTGNSFDLNNVYDDDGSYTVTVTVTDDDGDSGSDTVLVTVLNAAPTVSADESEVTVNESETAANTGTFGDAGDDTVTITASAGTVNQAGSQSGTWSWSFASTDGPDESQTVTITATDSDGAVSTTTFELIVLNVAPVAQDDAYGTAEDTLLSVPASGVLTNDSDVGADTLSATLLAGPANGTLTLNSNGSFDYLPNLNFNGVDSFTYTVTDDEGATATATVTITVDPVNDPPVAADDAYTTDEDTLLTVATPGVLTNDSDTENDPLSVSLDTDVSNGTLTLNADGSFSYLPNLNFNGSDSFTYHNNDGEFDSNIATVTITVDPVNDPPVAADDAYTTDEDTLLTVAAPGVLTNDSDTENDPLSVILDTDVSNGTLTLNADGSFSYLPNLNFNGSDSFTYHNNDGELDSNIVTVTITIDPVNDIPEVGDVLPTISCMWPPNHKFKAVGLVGGTDVDGDTVSFTVTGVRSDEPTKTAKGVGGKKAPDATGVGTDTANLRVERMGKEDGRVYTIQFVGTDGNGGTSEPGSVTVGVPHDQSPPDEPCGIITGDYDATVEN